MQGPTKTHAKTRVKTWIPIMEVGVLERRKISQFSGRIVILKLQYMKFWLLMKHEKNAFLLINELRELSVSFMVPSTSVVFRLSKCIGRKSGKEGSIFLT